MEGAAVDATLAVDTASVDAVITDAPPIATDELFEVAGRVLRDGGSLALLTTQTVVGAQVELIDRYPALHFQWLLAYNHPNAGHSVFQAHARTFWRPVLWATKGKYRGNWIDDMTPVGEDGLQNLVEQLTAPTDIVLDPYCGVGQVGEAALALDRDFLGCDSDGIALAEARRRIGC